MRGFLRRVVPLTWRRRVVALRDHWQQWRNLRSARFALRRFTRSGPPEPLTVGIPDVAAIPVVMCMWQRPERIADVLAELAAQTVTRRVRLLIWNNDPTNDDRYVRSIANGVRGALSSVELFSSDVNVGGAGRMLAADWLVAHGYEGPVVLIDDPQRVGKGFVDALLESWKPRTYAGVWAWRIHSDYWDRSAAGPDENASYVGTGGSIVDASLLVDPHLRSALAGPSLMLEDILLSWRAHAAGYRVRAAEAEFEFVEDQRDQWRALAEAKPRLYDALGRFALSPRGDAR